MVGEIESDIRPAPACWLIRLARAENKLDASCKPPAAALLIDQIRPGSPNVLSSSQGRLKLFSVS